MSLNNGFYESVINNLIDEEIHKLIGAFDAYFITLNVRNILSFNYRFCKIPLFRKPSGQPL